MSWTQRLREKLNLSRFKLASYLGLSVRTLEAAEQARRPLPAMSTVSCVALFKALQHAEVSGPASGPPVNEALHRRTLQRLYNRCLRRLDEVAAALLKMETAYQNAGVCLSAYRHLVQTLGPPLNNEDSARHKWLQHRMEEETQRMKDNGPVAQEVLIVKTAGLQAAIDRLTEMMDKEPG